MTDLPTLLQRHLNPDITEKEKAEIEREAWEGEKVKKGGFLRFIYLTFGGTISSTKSRSEILSLGKDGNVLWGRVDKKELPVSTAEKLAIQAYKLGKTMPLQEAVEKVLQEYDALRWVRWTPNGVPYRSPNKGASKKPMVAKSPEKSAGKKRKGQKPALFWQKIRELSTQFLDQQLAEVDPITLQAMKERFCKELELVFRELQYAIKAERGEHKKDLLALTDSKYRRKFLEAQRVLVMYREPPSLNRPFDLKKAASQKKKLVLQCHPDITKGGAGDFNRVIEAYNFMVEHNKKLNEGGLIK